MSEKYRLKALTDVDREILERREEGFMVPADRQLTAEQKDSLYRVEALRDFGDVKRGDIGGFVERNYDHPLGYDPDFPPISHEDDSWLYDDSIMINTSLIGEDAKIYNDSFLSRGRVNDSEVNNGTIHHTRVSGSLIDHSRVNRVAVFVDNSEIRNSYIQKAERVHGSVLDGATLRCDPNWEGASVQSSTIHDSIIIDNMRVVNGTQLKDSKVDSSSLNNSLIVGADLRGMTANKSDIHHSQMEYVEVDDRVVFENENIREERLPTLSESDLSDLSSENDLQR